MSPAEIIQSVRTLQDERDELRHLLARIADANVAADGDEVVLRLPADMWAALCSTARVFAR